MERKNLKRKPLNVEFTIEARVICSSICERLSIKYAYMIMSVCVGPEIVRIVWIH